jgi:hypothetical protein
MAQAQQDPNGAKLLPHTNLPLHLPILGQQNPHYFGGKDPHLLKPPTVLNAAGGFGRRASDGGANLHMAWGTPGSHEQLSMMSTSSSGNPSLSSGTVTQPLEHSQPALDELAAVARYAFAPHDSLSLTIHLKVHAREGERQTSHHGQPRGRPLLAVGGRIRGTHQTYRPSDGDGAPTRYQRSAVFVNNRRVVVCVACFCVTKYFLFRPFFIFSFFFLVLFMCNMHALFSNPT